MSLASDLAESTIGDVLRRPDGLRAELVERREGSFGEEVRLDAPDGSLRIWSDLSALARDGWTLVGGPLPVAPPSASTNVAADLLGALPASLARQLHAALTARLGRPPTSDEVREVMGALRETAGELAAILGAEVRP